MTPKSNHTIKRPDKSAQKHSIIKQILEWGPTIIFFIVYLLTRDKSYNIFGVDYSGFIISTMVLTVLLLAAMFALWRLSGELSRMQIFTAIMVVVFGGLTTWFNDERFFKMKTTIVYGVLAGLLLIGLFLKKSWLQYLMGSILPMRDEGWIKLTRGLVVMFILLAIANEFVWRTMSNDAWVTLETFVFPGVLMVFLFVQIMLLKDYMIEESDNSDNSDYSTQDDSEKNE